MSETTEILAITFTGLVGIGGLLANYLGSRSRQTFENEQERRLDARTVLEQAAIAFTNTIHAVEHVTASASEVTRGRRRSRTAMIWTRR